MLTLLIIADLPNQVRHNKLATYKRLRALIADEARRFVVFCNVFHRATHCERRAGESANDANDRAIRTAALWLSAQLREDTSGPQVDGAKESAPRWAFGTDERFSGSSV